MLHDEDAADAHRCILVVEDEVLIRLMLCETLRDAGYDVIEAGTADEALVVLDLTVPDLIISDVKMPGSLDGIGLLALVKLAHPKLPIIITSGDFPASNAFAAGANNFISKPYGYRPMLSAVSDELTKPY